MEIFVTLWQLVGLLGKLVLDILSLAWHGWFVLLWAGWWVFGVNWKKTRAVLAQGAWAPVVLLLVLIALVWSRLSPGACGCLGFVSLPNFWWQLMAVGLIAGFTLMCGWLQGYMGWSPPEIQLEPPVHEHGSGHGAEHGAHH